MCYVPVHGGNGNSRNVSCSKPSLHCHKRPWEGVHLPFKFSLFSYSSMFVVVTS